MKQFIATFRREITQITNIPITAKDEADAEEQAYALIDSNRIGGDWESAGPGQIELDLIDEAAHLLGVL